MSIEKPNLTKLEKQAEVLHYRIVNTQFSLDKKPLQQKREKILEQIRGIKLKMEDEKEHQAVKDIDALFNKHRNELVIDVNNTRTPLNETLKIPLTYKPCGHTHNIHIKELMRFQRNVKLESVLLTKWSGTLRTNVNLEARFNCERCRTKIQKRFNETRLRREGERIGICIVTLRKL